MLVARTARKEKSTVLKSRMASLIAGVAVAFSIQTSASAFTPSGSLLADTIA